MKAAVFEGPGRIVVREIPTPRAEAGGCLVRVKACGICGSDIRNFRAGLRNGATGQVMGHEIGGVIEEVGEGCRRFRAGDGVAIAPDVSCGACPYCAQGLVNLCQHHRMLGTDWPGGFAEFCALPREVVERGIMHAIPPGMSFASAALAEPLASVLAAQDAAGIGKGCAVAVFGSGPVGCMHVEIARGRGASPVMVVGRRRVGMAARFAPDLLVSVEREDPVEKVRAATGGLGADVAIVATPSPDSLAQAVQAVRGRGLVILFGGLPRDRPGAVVDANRVHYREIRIMGSFSYTPRMHQEALTAIRDARITPELYITRVVPLGAITDAISSAERGETLKVIVDPWVAHERD